MVVKRKVRVRVVLDHVRCLVPANLNRVVTRIYFADEDNTGDPVLETVAEDRRDTLLAHPLQDGYRFDVHVQGEGETVFFKV